MSKLNLIAIVAIVATVTLVAGFAAPIFAQSNSTSGMRHSTGGNMTEYEHDLTEIHQYVTCMELYDQQ